MGQIRATFRRLTRDEKKSRIKKSSSLKAYSHKKKARVMPQKKYYRGQKCLSFLPNVRAGEAFLQTNTLKNCAAK